MSSLRVRVVVVVVVILAVRAVVMGGGGRAMEGEILAVVQTDG